MNVEAHTIELNGLVHPVSRPRDAALRFDYRVADTTRSGRTTVNHLLALGTATLYEASGIDCDLACELRPIWPGARLCGPALPVRTGPSDNLAIHRALGQARPGEVLVIDGRGCACGYFGEVLAVAAQVKEIAGLVIDGGVRDVQRLAEIGFPVFSRFVSVRRTTKNDPGHIGAQIAIGGTTINRGDIVIADSDGVIVLPVNIVEHVEAAAEQRATKEQEWLAQIRAGVSTIDLLGLTE